MSIRWEVHVHSLAKCMSFRWEVHVHSPRTCSCEQRWCLRLGCRGETGVNLQRYFSLFSILLRIHSVMETFKFKELGVSWNISGYRGDLMLTTLRCSESGVVKMAIFMNFTTNYCYWYSFNDNHICYLDNYRRRLIAPGRDKMGVAVLPGVMLYGPLGQFALPKLVGIN